MRKRGGLEKIIEKGGIVKLFHFGLLFVQFYLTKLFYRKELTSNNYGFAEAIFYPTLIDYWCRYADVVEEIKKLSKNMEKGKFSILDCGAGGEGISKFLTSPRYSTLLFDLTKDVFMGVKSKNAQPVIGDANMLPFADHSIDIVVATATLEHIPRNFRIKFFAELKRVCKSTIVLHFPVESDDGSFKGREYDIRFQNAHKQSFGFEDLYTAQHINSSHPRIEEIKKAFPDSKIVGRKNCDVWLKYSMLERKPLICFLAGLIYCLLWRRKDNRPPFYECMMTWPRVRPIQVLFTPEESYHRFCA